MQIKQVLPLNNTIIVLKNHSLSESCIKNTNTFNCKNMESLNIIYKRSIHTNSKIDMLNPFYVSGFADGESSFILSIVKRTYADSG